MPDSTLVLAKRPCKIGPSINTRTERHGDEDVPACDVPIVGIMLEVEELNVLLNDKGAHKAIFKPGTGKTPEPRFRQLKAFALVDKFEDATVAFHLGLSDVLTLEGVKLNAVKLEPQVGGLTACDVQVQCTPDTGNIALLIAYLNSDIDAEISFGKKAEKAKKQPELPMGSHAQNGNGEDGEGDDDAKGAAGGNADGTLAPHENLPAGVPPIHRRGDTH